MAKAAGTLALLGGLEWTEPSRAIDERLLEASDAPDVLVLPTAAAFEHPERVVERATEWFEQFGMKVRGLMVVNRRDAEADHNIAAARDARFVYVADGSPLHLRSVLKGSALYDAVRRVYESGGVLAAAGAAATVLCDPMVDPRGGAYTVGLGLVPGLAVFPYHGTTADHLRERSIDLLPPGAVLVGIDEQTALVRERDAWDVVGAGGVTLYRKGAEAVSLSAGETVVLPAPA